MELFMKRIEAHVATMVSRFPSLHLHSRYIKLLTELKHVLSLRLQFPQDLRSPVQHLTLWPQHPAKQLWLALRLGQQVLLLVGQCHLLGGR
jgi:hypothetical protein